MSLSSSLLATVQAIGADIKALRDRSTHTGYQDISTVTGLQGALDGKVPTTRTVAGKALSANVTLTKADVGLGNVDNTADNTKSFAASQITSGTLPPARLDAGVVVAVEQASNGTWPARPTGPLVVMWMRYPGQTSTPSGFSAGHDLLVSKAS